MRLISALEINELDDKLFQCQGVQREHLLNRFFMHKINKNEVKVKCYQFMPLKLSLITNLFLIHFSNLRTFISKI